MRTAQEKRVIRTFEMIIIWTLFVSLTLSGLVIANDRTAYISGNEENETVLFLI